LVAETLAGVSEGPAALAYAGEGSLLVGGAVFRFSDRSAQGVVELVNAEARLSNCSVRSLAGGGSQTLVVGFNLAGTGAKSMLLRAIGPSLVPFGVTAAMEDPQLRLFNGVGTEIRFNDDWQGEVALAGAFRRVGAFELSPTSKDAALLVELPGGGAYTAHASAVRGAGVALLEVYDAEGGVGTARLVNLSVRSQVGTAEGVLVLGFVVDGTVPQRLLIRGVGPTLQQFGVTEVLADPKIRLFDRQAALLQENDNWEGTAAMRAAFAQTGAFALPAGSRDAALLVSVAPGLYTVEVSGVGGTTGVALVEIYDAP
jgi:hypothetical protein